MALSRWPGDGLSLQLEDTDLTGRGGTLGAPVWVHGWLRCGHAHVYIDEHVSLCMHTVLSLIHI